MSGKPRGTVVCVLCTWRRSSASGFGKIVPVCQAAPGTWHLLGCENHISHGCEVSVWGLLHLLVFVCMLSDLHTLKQASGHTMLDCIVCFGSTKAGTIDACVSLSSLVWHLSNVSAARLRAIGRASSPEQLTYAQCATATMPNKPGTPDTSSTHAVFRMLSPPSVPATR